jgi:hypothetical protein
MNRFPLLATAPLGLGITVLMAGCPAPSQTTVAENPVTTNTAQAGTTATPLPPVRGFVRALHAVPGMGALSLSADGQKFGTVSYGDASAFAEVRDPKISVSVYGSDGKKVAGPVPLELKDKRDVTILITGVPGDTVLLPWKHKDSGPVKGLAKIAFVHSAKALPPVDIALDGKTFRRDVKFGVATDPTTLSPGRHRVTVTYDKSLAPQLVVVQGGPVVTQDETGQTLSVVQPTPVQTLVPRHQMVMLTLEVDLMANKVYSLAVFHDGAHEPKVRLMENQFSAAKKEQ